MVWMTLFHLGFDLSFLGYWKQDFLLNLVWTLQRTCIVGLFLFCAGLAQSVAWSQKQTWRRFFRRWVQVAACALLVSAGSYAIFPQSFIYFGVLHGLAVMLLLARLTALSGPWLWIAGAIVLTLPSLAAEALVGPLRDWAGVFNAPSLNWLGLISRRPFTEDYVPVLPWMGVLWWGMAAGQWLLKHRPDWLQRPVPLRMHPLVVLGRWSLSYYMLHQPVLLGALWVYGMAAGHLLHAR